MNPYEMSRAFCVKYEQTENDFNKYECHTKRQYSYQTEPKKKGKYYFLMHQ